MSTTLLPYQQRWIDDDSPVKVWDADRQIGTTFAALHEVAERLLSVRVDGDTCAALWIADSEWAHSEAQREFQGMNGQVVWSVGVPTHAVDHMAGILGPLGIVVVDNVEPTPALVRYLIALSGHGVHVQAITSGSPDRGLAWSVALDGSSSHCTTLADAVCLGLGRRVAHERGERWSYAWEHRWLARIADSLEFRADCPRFHGVASSRGMGRDATIRRLARNGADWHAIAEGTGVTYAEVVAILGAS